jgi:hypothetical protein
MLLVLIFIEAARRLSHFLNLSSTVSAPAQ